MERRPNRKAPFKIKKTAARCPSQFRCIICKVDCWTKSYYERHILGREHYMTRISYTCQNKKKKIQHLRKRASSVSVLPVYYNRCAECKYDCYNAESWETHMNSKTHDGKQPRPEDLVRIADMTDMHGKRIAKMYLQYY